MKSLSVSEAKTAVERFADYYRDSNLYTWMSNSDDAYRYYISEFTHDTEEIIRQGHSYQNKGNYLCAVRLDVFEKEHPEEFHHYFDCVWDVLRPFVNREPADVIFICAVGPSIKNFTRDTYKLINEFVKQYRRSYTILTDCPVFYDSEHFSENTGAQLVTIAGRQYFRWAAER